MGDRVFQPLLVIRTTSVCKPFPVSHLAPSAESDWAGVISIFLIGRLRPRKRRMITQSHILNKREREFSRPQVMLSLSLASSWGAGDVKVDSNIYGDILSHHVPSDAHCGPCSWDHW